MTKRHHIYQLMWNALERNRLFNENPSTIRAKELADAEAAVDAAITSQNNCDELDTTPLHSADEIPY